MEPIMSNNTIISEWEKFYLDYFGITVDLSTVKIPEYKKGFDRIIIIPQGLTIEAVVKATKSKMNLWTWKSDNDLMDADIPINDRNPKNGTYAIRIRDIKGADEEMKNKSANDLSRKSISGMTLLERLVFELKYYSETNKHLDIYTVTLCSGSRSADGDVPDVNWGSDSGRLYVGCFSPDYSGDGLRSRVVVS